VPSSVAATVSQGSQAGSGRQALRRSLLVPALLLIAWIIASHNGLLHSNLLVPPERVLMLPFGDEAGQQIWAALAASIARMAAGFAMGAVGGVGFGLAIGMSLAAQRALAPSFNALRQITLFAWIPLLTAWFGNGDGAKIVYIALSAFFPLAFNTYEGIRNIPATYVEVARVLRFTPRQRVTRLLLPGALPSICIGVQVALITAWIGTVGAEYAMGAGRGLGSFLLQGREQFRMDAVLLGVLVLALVGYAINVAFSRMLRPFLLWQGEAK
jgi:sulfonate transport system permease protein